MSSAVGQSDRHDVPSAPDHPVAATGVPALTRGVLAIRWAVWAWMLVVVAAAWVSGDEPDLGSAVAGLLLVAAWVGWLTVARPSRSSGVLLADLVVAAALVVLGARIPWFATVYPVTAALAWGTARGVAGGLVAGGTLGLVAILARLGVAPDPQVTPIAVLRDPVYFLLAGGGIGFVADLLERSAAQVRDAQDEQVRATERAARATEREALGRRIHDSVLQALALVHKRGRELAAHAHVDGAEVRRLAELAASQERALRAIVLRGDDHTGESDAAGLREQLQRIADDAAPHVQTTVTVVGDPRLAPDRLGELGDAVRQAVANVVRHASAAQAWIFAEVADGDVVVSVRDDGRGFTYDPDALRAAGRFGLLHSIAGRVEDLGGRLTVDTAPGRGTELELRVPLDDHHRDAAARADGRTGAGT